MADDEFHKSQFVNAVLDQVEMNSTSEPNKEMRMNSTSEPSKEVRSSHIDRDQCCRFELKKLIKETINLFDKQLQKEVLFNIKTGRRASDTVQKFLLNILKNREEKRDEFAEDSKEDVARFEKPISRVKVMNFASENFNQKNTSQKVAEISGVKGTRDLFGRLLYLSISHDIDLAKVLQYPILPEPACFAHTDGAMRQSDKAKVFHELKDKVTSQRCCHP